MRITVFFCLSVPPQCICCLLKCKNNYHGAQIYISNLLHLFIYESSHSLFSFSPHLHCSLIQLYCLSAPPSHPHPSPVLCGISVQRRSGAAVSPVLFWLDLTLLLVFSCIVRSYSLTSSKPIPVGRAKYKYTHTTNTQH